MPTNSATNTILTKTFVTLGQSNAGLLTKFVDNFVSNYYLLQGPLQLTGSMVLALSTQQSSSLALQVILSMVCPND